MGGGGGESRGLGGGPKKNGEKTKKKTSEIQVAVMLFRGKMAFKKKIKDD